MGMNRKMQYQSEQITKTSQIKLTVHDKTFFHLFSL